MSQDGLIPFVSIYSTFLQRGYDEISHDLAKTNMNVTLLVDRAGLVGNDGSSHQGIYDEAFLMSIPNTVITMASNKGQIKSLLNESLNNHGVFTIRYCKNACEGDYPEESLPFGKWKEELTGKKVVVVSVGPETEELKELLKDKGITLVNAIYQKPLDEDWVKKLLGYDKVIIYDAYSVEGGFPQFLASRLMTEGFKGQVIIKAIPDVFVKHASVEEQKAEFGLLPEDIVKLL